MRDLMICVLMVLSFAAQALGSNVVIDGVLDEAIYTKVTPLKGEISSLYLVPMSDGVYIGAEVEDANINVGNPQEFWNGSCVEIWFDWANDDSPAFDQNDQQFWFCPVKGKGDEGYSGQWHRAADNIPATMYDYGSQSDMIDMAFVVNTGKGYTIEARIAKEAMSGYTPNGTIGFTYSADKGGTKYEWENAKLGGNFYELPNLWPDLEISEVLLAVRPGGKLSASWGDVRRALLNQ